MRRLLATAPVLLAVTLLAGCSDSDSGSGDREPVTDDTAQADADCFAVQQVALFTAPSAPELKPAQLDALAGIGFTRTTMCVSFDPFVVGDGWQLGETRVRVTRANRDDAWAGAVFERVLPGSASDEGAGSALPLIVPFDYAGQFGGTDQCFRITLEATVSRGSVEGTWSGSGLRGICPGSRYDRESLADLEG